MQLSPSFLALAVALSAAGLVDAAPARVTRSNDPAVYGLVSASDESTLVNAEVHSNGKQHAAKVDAKLCLDGLLGYVDCKTGAKPNTSSNKKQSSHPPAKKPASAKKAAGKRPTNHKPAVLKPSSKKPPPPPPASAPGAQPKQQVTSNASTAQKPVKNGIVAAAAGPSKLSDASAHGGNGGIASGGSAACSAGNNLIGLNALNFNSCNGGNGGSAAGGSATGGRTGTINVLPRSDSQSLVDGLLHGLGLRRRADVPSSTQPDTETSPTEMSMSDAQDDNTPDSADKGPQVNGDGDDHQDKMADGLQARQTTQTPSAEGSLDGKSAQGNMEARQVDNDDLDDDEDSDDMDYTPSAGHLAPSDEDVEGGNSGVNPERRLVIDYPAAFSDPESKSMASMMRRALYSLLPVAAKSES